jgi:hypothetical protein
LPPPQGIFTLNRRDRLNCVSTTNGLHTGLGKSEVFHLTFLDEVFHRARHVFDRNIRINTVLIEQIDCISLKPLERGLGDLLDMLWPTV